MCLCGAMHWAGPEPWKVSWALFHPPPLLPPWLWAMTSLQQTHPDSSALVPDLQEPPPELKVGYMGPSGPPPYDPEHNKPSPQLAFLDAHPHSGVQKASARR